jgi:hypothetical protein
MRRTEDGEECWDDAELHHAVTHELEDGTFETACGELVRPSLRCLHFGPDDPLSTLSSPPIPQPTCEVCRDVVDGARA